MRVSLDQRAMRIVRRIPRTTVYSGLELALLSLVAIQCARLVWTMVTPVGPIGDWRATSSVPVAAPVDPASFAAFDPFFRLNGDAGPVQVTSLNIKLFGVREDKATGRGSAIISTPDGQQRSFAVGDEIVPGVMLTGVSFDSVTISRNGTAEQLFLDQSTPAPVAGGAPAQQVLVAPPVAPPPPPQALPVVQAPQREPAVVNTQNMPANRARESR